MKALILGGSGSVGGHVLRGCLLDPKITSIVAITRTPLGITDSRLHEVIHNDFSDLSSLEGSFSDFDLCYFCIGVFQGSVDKQSFIRISLGFVEEIIRVLVKESPKCIFCLFSARGADIKGKSPILFSKYKGLAEKALVNSSLQHYIFRPGHIDAPPKKSDPAYAFLLRPIFRIYPSIGVRAESFAKVIIHVSMNGSPKRILENKHILAVERSIA